MGVDARARGTRDWFVEAEGVEFEGGSEMAFREGEMFVPLLLPVGGLDAAHTSLKIHHAEERGERREERGERERRILLFYVEKGRKHSRRD